MSGIPHGSPIALPNTPAGEESAGGSGVAFPTTAVTGDRFWRIDLGEGFHYDGTRWLTDTLHHISIANNPTTADADITTTQNPFRTAILTDYANVFLEAVSTHYKVLTTNDGSNYWTFDFGPNDGSGITILATVTSAAESADAHHRETVSSIDTVVATGIELFWTSKVAKTGSPGAVTDHGLMFTYRGIAT